MLNLREINLDHLSNLAMRAIEVNEIGDDPNLAYKFSDADGLRTGKSGYSFGRVQFDIKHNWMALDCLRDCGFRPTDLARLYAQTEYIGDLDARLRRNSAVVDRYDLAHVRESVEHCVRLTSVSRIRLRDEETLVHIVDYHNQLYMSRDGLLHKWLSRHGSVIKPESILVVKLTLTRWGRTHPRDVHRRYNNINRMFKEAP